MHTKNIIYSGTPLADAKKALILLHGRGANARDILELSGLLNVKGYSLLAPEATNNTWYPLSFLAPPAANEPWLSSALNLVDQVVAEALAAGLQKSHIYFTGFSQGACLTLEYVTRNAARYGGVAAFTGGLIGDKINRDNYKGAFENTPVFIGTSDPDPHVPVQRVYATSNIMTELGASVTHKVYENMGHTIINDEIELANKLVFNLPQQ